MVGNTSRNPPPHNKGTKIRQWNPRNMAKAIAAVRKPKMGWLKASKTFQVPQKTLRRLADEKYGTPEEAANCRHGRPPAFSPELEQQLVRYCLTMETSFFGLTRKDLRRMALQLAVRNNIKHPFNDIMAGKSWLRSQKGLKLNHAPGENCSSQKTMMVHHHLQVMMQNAFFAKDFIHKIAKERNGFSAYLVRTGHTQNVPVLKKTFIFVIIVNRSSFITVNFLFHGFLLIFL
jgi:hypothetical protein